MHRLGIGIGKHFFRISSGIPQGMHLSGVLSELYYYYVDSINLRDFQQTKDDELYVRYCDDYLFITSSKERAQQ